MDLSIAVTSVTRVQMKIIIQIRKENTNVIENSYRISYLLDQP